MKVVHRDPHGMPPPRLRGRPLLWLGMVGWTVLVALILGWLLTSNGGPSVWVFQERDLEQPGLGDKVHAIFGSALRLQRSYPWILFSPYLALVAWFFPLQRERLHRNLPVNLAACLGFLLACHAVGSGWAGFRTRVLLAPGPPPLDSNEPGLLHLPMSPGSGEGQVRWLRPLPDPSPQRPPSLRSIMRSSILDLLAYGAITGLVHSVYFQRQLRERERRELLLESHLAKARLDTLKAQLQPHFLFNSLNAITALLRRDPRQAETTLVALGELLRMALSQSGRQEGSLREELEFVRRYVEIQQTRFGDRLRVEQDIEPAALDCQVPTLVLQPLVENAIRHGIEPAGRTGTVRLGAARQGSVLVLTVEDDGVGLGGDEVIGGPVRPELFAPARKPDRDGGGTGIGLANLRDRLRALHGSRQKLELLSRASGGVTVRVEIPWDVRNSSDNTGSPEA
ncbi:MAG: histidine kinase [Verrucomicrobiales bacterium]|nr:histidine kinase [Verrucomicrobiales bacterium]